MPGYMPAADHAAQNGVLVRGLAGTIFAQHFGAGIDGLDNHLGREFLGDDDQGDVARIAPDPFGRRGNAPFYCGKIFSN